MGKRCVALLGALMLATAVSSTSTVAVAGRGSSTVGLAGLADQYKHVRQVSSMAEFLEYADDANTAVVLASESSDPGGNYVFEACPDGVDERSDNSCGMVVLGPGTGIFGDGQNEILDGVPTGHTVNEGPLLDCGALVSDELRGPGEWGPGDFNGWDLACIEMAGDNTISGVRIDNGPEAQSQPPGFGRHRNGVLVQPGDGRTVIEHSVLTDVRRGVLIAAGDGAKSEVVAYANVIRRTELAGLFSIASAIPPVSVSDAEMEITFESNFLDEVGFIGIVYAWAVGGERNTTDGEFSDNVIGPNSVHGIAVFAEGFLTPEPVVDHYSTLTVRGGSISSPVFGVPVFVYDNGPAPANTGNSLHVELDNVEFSQSALPVYVEYDPWGPDNRYVVEMIENEYTDGEPGLVDVCAFSYVTFDCAAPAGDVPFQLVGSRNDLEEENTNFSFEMADIYFDR